MYFLMKEREKACFHTIYVHKLNKSYELYPYHLIFLQNKGYEWKPHKKWYVNAQITRLYLNCTLCILRRSHICPIAHSRRNPAPRWLEPAHAQPPAVIWGPQRTP